LETLEDRDLLGELGVYLYLLFTCRGGLIELFEEFWSIKVIMVNPQIIGGWVSLPMDEILELSSSSISSNISNVLNFILFFTFFHHWRWSDVVSTVG